MMTSEKAIQLLHRLQDEQFDGEYGDERREALEMAVRALEGDGDTISRKAAIDIVRNRVKKFTTACVLAVTEIEQLPPAQPERKKGKWIEKENSPFYCSVCGTYQYSASWEIKNKEYNFCPRCGADMRGENNEML